MERGSVWSYQTSPQEVTNPGIQLGQCRAKSPWRLSQTMTSFSEGWGGQLQQHRGNQVVREGGNRELLLSGCLHVGLGHSAIPSLHPS